VKADEYGDFRQNIKFLYDLALIENNSGNPLFPPTPLKMAEATTDVPHTELHEEKDNATITSSDKIRVTPGRTRMDQTRLLKPGETPIPAKRTSLQLTPSKSNDSYVLMTPFDFEKKKPWDDDALSEATKKAMKDCYIQGRKDGSLFGSIKGKSHSDTISVRSKVQNFFERSDKFESILEHDPVHLNTAAETVAIDKSE
jgi:hypothetical protein